MATVTSYDKGEKCTVDYTASGADVAVDEIVVLGAAGAVSVGVAQVAIADGSTGSVDIAGVYTFPKVSAGVIAQGETVDWDSSAGEVDDNAMTPASGDVSDFAVALEAAGNGVTTVKIKLLPGNGAIT